MNDFFDLPTVMPVLAVLFTLIIIVVFIVVYGKTKQTEYMVINQKSFEELANDLKSDHAALKSELAAIKEDMNSINRMMKDIQ